MKKVVVKLDLHDDKDKQKVMKTVSSLSGIESIAIDMKEQKLTVIGNVDPVVVVSKLRKGNWHTQILTVGPKEEKKDEAKKDDSKKDEAKKDEGKKDESQKDEKPKDQNEQNIAELVKLYKAYNPYMTQYYHVVSVEENPNTCVIC